MTLKKEIRLLALQTSNATYAFKEPQNLKYQLEGDVLMITSGNNASKNECPTVGTDESK